MAPNFFASKELFTSTPKKPGEAQTEQLIVDTETIEIVEVDEQTLNALEQQSLKRRAEEELVNETHKRSSLDSTDLMTDDESAHGEPLNDTSLNQNSIQEPQAGSSQEQESGLQDSQATEKSASDTIEGNTSIENLTTPERIKRGLTGIRVSRDSGITSPEPADDELLTVTVTESSQPRRDSSESTDTDKTADVGAPSATDATFSQHDQQLVEKAQQKYQEQVSEMQNLVEKVNQWHQHLKPILKESQARGHFEIHDYGTRVMESFGDGDHQQEITFGDVMQNKPGDSIARYFLSTLMLVNTGNVEMTSLNTDASRVTELDELKLKLKSRVRLHETLENMDETVPYHTTKSRKRPSHDQAASSSKTKKQKTQKLG